MKLPFKTPVQLEDGEYLVAHDCELISHLFDTTLKERRAITKCINAAAEANQVIEALRLSLAAWVDFADGDEYGLESDHDAIKRADKFLRKYK